jgi:hypothetical protein
MTRTKSVHSNLISDRNDEDNSIRSFSGSVGCLESVSPLGTQIFRVKFELSGDLSRIVWPSPGLGPSNTPCPPYERKDDLWKETCFEAFFSTPGSKAYWELNANTRGEWNLYEFDEYRKRMRPAATTGIHAVEIHQKTNNDFSFSIDFYAPKIWNQFKILEISLTSVIVIQKNKIPVSSYWACCHKGEKPDFHLRESFVLCLNLE